MKDNQQEKDMQGMESKAACTPNQRKGDFDEHNSSWEIDDFDEQKSSWEAGVFNEVESCRMLDNKGSDGFEIDLKDDGSQIVLESDGSATILESNISKTISESEGSEILLEEVFISSGAGFSAEKPETRDFFKETNSIVNAALLNFLSMQGDFPPGDAEIVIKMACEDSISESTIVEGSDLHLISPENPSLQGIPDEVSVLQSASPASEWQVLFQDHPWFNPAKKTESPRSSDVHSSSELSPISIYTSNEKEKFYLEAVRCADREEVVGEEVPFSTYFPQYLVMSPRQQDWYFYWRSNVRRGIFIQTSASYIFLYLYELIHLVGFSSPREALDQMLFVWGEARYKSLVFDPYMACWVRDFILYYGLEMEYYEVIEKVLGQMSGKYLYQECLTFLFEGKRRPGILFALEECADYRISESHFAKNGYAGLLEDALCCVLLQWNSKLSQKGKPGLLASFSNSTSTLPDFFRPFDSALFYEHGQMAQSDGNRLNSGILFTFSSRIIGSSLILGLNDNRKFRKFMTGLIRTVESVLRDREGYRWSIHKGPLPKSKLALVEKQANAFYDHYLLECKRKERKIFRVNDELLGRLKEDSDSIRTHLIQEQERAGVQIPSVEFHLNQPHVAMHVPVLSPEAVPRTKVSSYVPGRQTDPPVPFISSNVASTPISSPDISDTKMSFSTPVLAAPDTPMSFSTPVPALPDKESSMSPSGQVVLDGQEVSSVPVARTSGREDNPFCQLLQSLSPGQYAFVQALCQSTQGLKPQLETGMVGDIHLNKNPMQTPASPDGLLIISEDIASGSSNPDGLLKKLKDIASASNSFLNVIIEEINEKSLECVGDGIIDTGGVVPCIYPDYLKEIAEVFLDSR